MNPFRTSILRRQNHVILAILGAFTLGAICAICASAQDRDEAYHKSQRASSLGGEYRLPNGRFARLTPSEAEAMEALYDQRELTNRLDVAAKMLKDAGDEVGADLVQMLADDHAEKAEEMLQALEETIAAETPRAKRLEEVARNRNGVPVAPRLNPPAAVPRPVEDPAPAPAPPKAEDSTPKPKFEEPEFKVEEDGRVVPPPAPVPAPVPMPVPEGLKPAEPEPAASD